MELSRAICIALIGLSTSSVASQSRLVAPLERQDVIQGCAWSASAPALGRGIIFFGEINDSVNLMNIGGKDVELSLTSTTGSLSALGNTLKRTFVASGVTVVATFKVNWVCPEGGETCEGTRFDVDFDVTAGDRHERVNGTGEVGC